MDESLELVSLQDIILSKVTSRKVFEAYVKLQESLENDHVNDSTLILKRTKLLFNDKECVFLNFRDVSTFKRLKQEEKKSQLMTTLYSCVHHEMLGPLKNSFEASMRLIRSLTDQNLRQLA